MMKHWIGCLVIACCVTACVTPTNTVARRQIEEKALQQISDSINNRSLTVEFDYVIPRTFPPQHLTANYYVRIDGDSLTSYLPFFGRAYRADYNNQTQSPLSFEGHVSELAATHTKKGSMRITLKTKRDMEALTYNLEIFANGKATLDVLSTDRESISFNGQTQMEKQ